MSTAEDSPHLSRLYAWFSAIMQGDNELLENLLIHGMPIDCLHPLRQTTGLFEAARHGNASLVQWLLEHGATAQRCDGQSANTALHVALRRHHWPIASMLAQSMPHCGVMDSVGATPLHVLCAEFSQENEIELALGLGAILIAKNCPLDALDHEGTTALHHCVLNNLIEVAELLLKHGANPNALIPDSKVSPLMVAALEKNAGIARLLMAHGADPTLETHEGLSPLAVYNDLQDFPVKKAIGAVNTPTPARRTGSKHN